MLSKAVVDKLKPVHFYQISMLRIESICQSSNKIRQNLFSMSTSTYQNILFNPLYAGLFVLILYVPVNYFSVMSGQFPVFLG